ncbi:MAG: T9SS type A sorting domain-containing protein [Bacteroidota bacterium]
MKQIFTYLLLSVFTLSAVVAQNRYDDEIFTEVEVTSDVTYGVNATVLAFSIFGEAIPEELKMDVYQPVGDSESERPVVLVWHTGNFLPNVTNAAITGTKTDSSAVEICTQLARRGFVAASCTYRKGWNPLAVTQPERALGLIQAAYRGVQDGRTAIRFIKKTVAEEGNPYGVDTTKMVMWGNGTGGYLVLGTNGLSNYSEIIQTSNPAGKFLLDLDMNGVPETPMVVPAYHGDINGEVLSVTPDDAFGLPAGDTTTYPNHVQYTNDYQLTVNVGGALGDISWLNDQAIPIISVQSIDDQFAPYNDGILRVPNTGDPIVQVQGAQQIGMVQEASGINQPWKDFMFNDAVTMEAMANAATAGHPYYEGSYAWKSPNNSGGEDEGVVIDWWVPTSLSPPILPNFPNGVPWNQLPHPTDDTDMTSFHEEGLELNENMSAEKARANIAKIMDYVIPRACITLELGCASVDVRDLLSNDLVELAPNPSRGNVLINSPADQPMLDLEVYNMEGRLVLTQRNVNQAQYSLDLASEMPGMYLVKIYLDEGVVVKKLIIE